MLIEVEDYNLNNTMTPSFVSSLYARLLGNRWCKIAGYLAGKLELVQSKPEILEVRCTATISKKSLLDQALLETGLWHEAFESQIARLSPRVKSKVEALAAIYPGVRLPVAPEDFDYLLIAIALSKRASYDIVLRWCRQIFRHYGADLSFIANLPKIELRKISNSYQLTDLQRTLKSYIELIDSNAILKLSPEAARKALMCCFGLGPKTIDSLILSTFKAPHFIPCDVHLKTVVERLGLIEDNLKLEMPAKPFCTRYICGSCIRSKICIRSKLSFLGELGGWLQTLAYLHGQSYCHSYAPRCKECKVKICEKF